jgi:hypothetical protein
MRQVQPRAGAFSSGMKAVLPATDDVAESGLRDPTFPGLIRLLSLHMNVKNLQELLDQAGNTVELLRDSRLGPTSTRRPGRRLACLPREQRLRRRVANRPAIAVPSYGEQVTRDLWRFQIQDPTPGIRLDPVAPSGRLHQRQAAVVPRVARRRQLRGDQCPGRQLRVRRHQALLPQPVGAEIRLVRQFDHDFIGRDALAAIEPEAQRCRVHLPAELRELLEKYGIAAEQQVLKGTLAAPRGPVLEALSGLWPGDRCGWALAMPFDLPLLPRPS